MSECSKVPCPSDWAAQLALHAIQGRDAGRGRKVPKGLYLCKSCGRWHLTSQSGVQTPPWAKGASPPNRAS